MQKSKSSFFALKCKRIWILFCIISFHSNQIWKMLSRTRTRDEFEEVKNEIGLLWRKRRIWMRDLDWPPPHLNLIKRSGLKRCIGVSEFAENNASQFINARRLNTFCHSAAGLHVCREIVTFARARSQWNTNVATAYVWRRGEWRQKRI